MSSLREDSLLGGTSVDDYSRNSSAVNSYARRRRKRQRKRRILIVVVIILLVLVGGTAGFALTYINGINQSMLINKNDSVYDALDNTKKGKGDPFYTLLIGVDSSEDREKDDDFGGAYRADTIILARVDPDDQRITLVSIHRDTLVDLSQYGGTGNDKINAAYAYGGRELMVQQVSKLAGVPISHYAEINFDGMVSLVDALGGVDIYVEQSFYDPTLEFGLDKGWYTLDGTQALYYARCRHAFDAYGDGDRYRAKHQRQVIAAIVEKFSQSNVGTLANTVQQLAPYVSTDMDVQTIAGYASNFIGVDINNCVYSAMEPTTSEVIKGTYYEKIDETAWKTMMAKVDAGEDPGVDTAANEKQGDVSKVDAFAEDNGSSTSSATSTASTTVNASKYKVTIRNGVGVDGVASQAADKITPAGYQIESTGNADSFVYDETLVVYNDDSQKAVADDIVSRLGVGRAIKNSNRYSFSGDLLIVVGSDWKV